MPQVKDNPAMRRYEMGSGDSAAFVEYRRAGDRIALLYPSANRDERVFDDPFRFDTTRAPNPHIAFGFGPHVCIGQALARLELQVVFTEMPRRFTNLRVVTEPNIFAGAVERFELAFDRR